MRILILLTGLFICAACTTKPEPIAFGKDQCAYCKMVIADPNYGGELITSKGRIYKFDAAECMIDYLNENEVSVSDKLAIAFDDPKNLHPVDSLYFIIDRKYKSPMGANLAAFYDRTAADTDIGHFLRWKEIKNKRITN